MGILNRYILREHVGPFFLGFFVIIFILVVDLVLHMLDLFLKKGTSAIVVLELFLLSLAWIIALAAPMAVLIAVLMAFGRLSSDNELTALKASGIGLHRLILPVFWVASFLMVALFLFNNNVLPDFNYRARNLISDLRRKKPALALKEKEGLFINDLENYSVLIKKISEDGSSVRDVTVYERKGPGEFPTPIHAERGEVLFSEDGSHMTLILYDGEIHQIDSDDPKKYIRTTFKKYTVHISDVGRSFTRTESDYRGDREMSVGMMRDKIQLRRAEISEEQRRIDEIVRSYLDHLLFREGRTASESPSVGSDLYPVSMEQRGQAAKGPSAVEEMREVLREIRGQMAMTEQKQKKINQYQVEIHKKFSIPAACLVFVLIGAPLGVRVRRGSAAVGIGISIGFFVLYWAFLIGGEEIADRGLVSPALAMWTANWMIGGIGLYLTLRAIVDPAPLGRKLIRRLQRLLPSQRSGTTASDRSANGSS